MASKKHITQKFPSTGALPSEQAASQLKELHPGNGGKNWVWQQDKLIWQLVMNCVDFASQQFESNLKFNAQTLTDVLYDNIYKLLGDKLNEEQFAQNVVDKLIESGCVVNSDPEKATPEIVTQVDDSQYRELISQVDATIQLLKTRKLELFKAFNEINQTIDDGRNGKEQEAERSNARLV